MTALRPLLYLFGALLGFALNPWLGGALFAALLVWFVRGPR